MERENDGSQPLEQRTPAHKEGKQDHDADAIREVEPKKKVRAWDGQKVVKEDLFGNKYLDYP